MAWDPTRDAWFSGLADGEATFLINRQAPRKTDGRYRFAPRFVLGLRADELPILTMLRAAFGGTLVFDSRPQGRAVRLRLLEGS